LETEKISKSFSGVRVLEAVDFDLKEAEVHALAGENGAGKTTLIKILSGVHTDYEGVIKLRGEVVRFKSPQEAARKGIVAIYQELSLVNQMSVLDNIFLGREIRKRPGFIDYRSEQQKAREILENLGLKINLSEPAGFYPYSIRQMIEVAKALVQEARIIIMDEPTSALNQAEVARLFTLIADLKKKGCSLIYISHRLEEIYRLADRITVLRDGHKVGTSPASELPPSELVRWMVGREITQQFPPYFSCRGPEKLCVSNLFIPDPSGLKRWVVEDVSFSLHRGEIVGFAGLQGSGKSELFHGIFGSLGQKIRGEIYLDGKPFISHSPHESIRQGLALLTNDRQATGLIPSMNVTRNITIASLNKFSPRGWLRPAEERRKAREYVEMLRIKLRHLDQEIQTLSGGNQQKVILARWLETKPRVWLLDEPTLGIDVGAKYDIYCLMNEWKARGMAIALITSELPELLAMADRILVLHRGKIVAEFSHDEATQEKIIEAALGGGQENMPEILDKGNLKAQQSISI